MEISYVPVLAILRDLYAQPAPAGGRIVNEAVGRFALWGYQRKK